MSVERIMTPLGGRRAVRCYECDELGPIRATGSDARTAAQAAGWARNYPRGRGEGFRCPACRAGVPAGTNTEPAPAAVSPEVAAKVLTVLHADEYFVSDDEQDLVEVLICDARNHVTSRFGDEQLLEFARAARLAVTDTGMDRLIELAAEAGR